MEGAIYKSSTDSPSHHDNNAKKKRSVLLQCHLVVEIFFTARWRFDSKLRSTTTKCTHCMYWCQAKMFTKIRVQIQVTNHNKNYLLRRPLHRQTKQSLWQWQPHKRKKYLTKLLRASDGYHTKINSKMGMGIHESIKKTCKQKKRDAQGQRSLKNRWWKVEKKRWKKNLAWRIKE